MFLLRHGQSYFNLHFNETRRDPGIEDPELTPVGMRQAVAAAAQLAHIPLTRIIVSPYTRALQTAQPFLTSHAARVDVMQEVCERAAFICDVGSNAVRLAERFPHHDFSALPEVWWHQGIETSEQTIARANAFRHWMVEQTDSQTTLVVSHWAFILALTARSMGNGELLEYDPASAAPDVIDWHH